MVYRIEIVFTAIASRVAVFSSSAAACTIAILCIAVWVIAGPIMHFSDTWQLIVNTLSSVVTFIMVFFINNAEARGSAELNAKLDRLLNLVERGELIVPERAATAREPEARHATSVYPRALEALLGELTVIDVHALPAGDSLERLGIALVLGLLIGFEREVRKGMAGLHTITLVCVGAVLFTILPTLIGGNVDPVRVAGQIVTGVGFLAGGVIIREGASLRGLATAATLWCTAAIGTLVGTGFFVQAVVGTVVIVGVNSVLQPLAEKLALTSATRSARKALHVRFTDVTMNVECAADSSERVHEAVVRESDAAALALRTFETTIDGKGNAAIAFELQQPGSNRALIGSLANTVSAIAGVASVRWKSQETVA